MWLKHYFHIWLSVKYLHLIFAMIIWSRWLQAQSIFILNLFIKWVKNLICYPDVSWMIEIIWKWIQHSNNPLLNLLVVNPSWNFYSNLYHSFVLYCCYLLYYLRFETDFALFCYQANVPLATIKILSNHSQFVKIPFASHQYYFHRELVQHRSKFPSYILSLLVPSN